ncbi:MAG: ribonuclease E/G [Acidimicrobiales bacterium]|nr:ribonuclease E/G [Hyphomonadaceae bacterium]RZV40327.1 MAG: ribonuclease E/G [Acidimicrobiales bacterium]
MANKCTIEHAIGETRAAILYKNKPVEYHLRRWSDEGLPRAGDIFAGRVTKVDKQLMAAFVDLGAGEPGLLRFAMTPNAPRLTEGQMILVRIVRDAEAHKGPLVEFTAKSEVDKPGPQKTGTLDEFIAARFPGISIEEGPVDGIDYVTDTEVALKNGGFIYIEHTRAGTMIDIDTAGGQKTKVSIAAAKEIASQLRLRGIGGLIVIDFPNFRKKKDRADVWQTLQDCLNNDPNITKIAPFSRFDTVEMTRSKSGLTIGQIMLDASGEPSVETLALRGLRRLEKEARVDGGARLVLQLPQKAYDWLQSGVILWEQPLAERIGARFKLVSGDKLDVFKDEK